MKGMFVASTDGKAEEARAYSAVFVGQTKEETIRHIAYCAHLEPGDVITDVAYEEWIVAENQPKVSAVCAIQPVFCEGRQTGMRVSIINYWFIQSMYGTHMSMAEYIGAGEE